MFKEYAHFLANSFKNGYGFWRFFTIFNILINSQQFFMILGIDHTLFVFIEVPLLIHKFIYSFPHSRYVCASTAHLLHVGRCRDFNTQILTYCLHTSIIYFWQSRMKYSLKKKVIFIINMILFHIAKYVTKMRPVLPKVNFHTKMQRLTKLCVFVLVSRKCVTSSFVYTLYNLSCKQTHPTCLQIIIRYIWLVSITKIVIC